MEWSTKENKGEIRENHDVYALELQRLAKKHVSGQSDIKQCKIKPIAWAVIELHLSEGISKWVSESVSQSVENSTK